MTHLFFWHFSNGPFSLFFFLNQPIMGQISNPKLGLNWRRGCACKTTGLGGPTRRSFVGKVELNRVANEREREIAVTLLCTVRLSSEKMGRDE